MFLNHAKQILRKFLLLRPRSLDNSKKLEWIAPTLSSLQDKQNEWSLYRVLSTGSEVRMNDTNHFYSSRPTKWMVAFIGFRHIYEKKLVFKLQNVQPYLDSFNMENTNWKFPKIVFVYQLKENRFYHLAELWELIDIFRTRDGFWTWLRHTAPWRWCFDRKGQRQRWVWSRSTKERKRQTKKTNFFRERQVRVF